MRHRCSLRAVTLSNAPERESFPSACKHTQWTPVDLILPKSQWNKRPYLNLSPGLQGQDIALITTLLLVRDVGPRHSDTDTLLCGEIVKVCCRITSTRQQWCYRQKLPSGVNLGTKIPSSRSEDKILSKCSTFHLTRPQHKRSFISTTETMDKSNVSQAVIEE